MPHLTAKSSTIFIAADGNTKVYRSVEDVPEPLRKRLIASTSSVNAATILIADRRGREELLRALEGRPTEVQFRAIETIRARKPEPTPEAKAAPPIHWSKPLWLRLRSVRTWLELLIPVAIGASLWLFIESHF